VVWGFFYEYATFLPIFILLRTTASHPLGIVEAPMTEREKVPQAPRRPQLDVYEHFADRPNVIDSLTRAGDVLKTIDAGALSRVEGNKKLGEIFDEAGLQDFLDTPIALEDQKTTVYPLAELRAKMQYDAYVERTSQQEQRMRESQFSPKKKERSSPPQLTPIFNAK
jgi:hypothetical protein